LVVIFVARLASWAALGGALILALAEAGKSAQQHSPQHLPSVAATNFCRTAPILTCSC
jgi:hypothetical protein